MSQFTWLLSIGLLAAALGRLVTVTRVLSRSRTIPRVSDTVDDWQGTGPLISVLVPARNEERRIEGCLRSLLSQRYTPFEVIAIDDGSTDRTAAIISSLAKEDPRLLPVQAGPLPAGWVGKNHALWCGVRRARGDWLLFTDADTVHCPEALAKAFAFARIRGLDMCSMTCHQQVLSFWERVVQPVVYGLLDAWFPLDEVGSPTSPLAAATGTYLLIRREVYNAVGGHRRVAGEILEDVALARLVKGAGHRMAFADGADLYAARMYSSLQEIRRGWGKNLFALVDRDLGRACRVAAGIFTTTVLPPLTFLLSGAARLLGAPAGIPAAVSGVISLGLLTMEGVFRARRGHDPRWALAHPLGSLVVLAILIESVYRGRLGKAVIWKERRYVGPRTSEAPPGILGVEE